MDLSKFVNMKESEIGFQAYYDAIITKLDGVDAVRSFIPFDDGALKSAYAEDKNFNSGLTPLHRWEDASGISVRPGQTTRPPRATGTGLFAFLNANGVTLASQSECICILKTAAEKIATA